MGWAPAHYLSMLNPNCHMIYVLSDLVLLTYVIGLYSPQVRREEEDAPPPLWLGLSVYG